MIRRLLIANRGEIACRIIDTARRLNIHTIAVWSDADRGARHVALADEAVRIGAAPASESYLRPDGILAAARNTRADAIHPGYGFLSENPDFVEAVNAAGLIFVGPGAVAIRAMGLKDAARQRMIEAGVPVVPGYHGAEQGDQKLGKEAQQIGYPVMIKARAGGGGKGIRVVQDAASFADALESVRREAQSAFGDPTVLIEKFIKSPRHIEVQVFGDDHGEVVHLFERDCSLQRRHQKVIEEAPAPGMSAAVREAMTQAAVTAARAINYTGAGTIEFIADGSGALTVDGFWFMEMNTRLQVEHPVTEAITGQDLVEWQLRVASGEALPCTQQQLSISGHAMEARLYAEDPEAGFLPAAGRLVHLEFGDARIDTGVRSGDEVSPFYDPMIAKLITHGPDREAARVALCDALTNTVTGGLVSNRAFLASLAAHPGFVAGGVDTGLIDTQLDTLLTKKAPSEEALLYAAVVTLSLDMNDAHAGFRLWGLASHVAALHIDGTWVSRRVSLEPDGSFCSGDPTTLDTTVSLCRLQREGPRGFRNQEGQSIACRHALWSEGGELCGVVIVDGCQHVVRRADPLQSREDALTGGSAIVAPMTGTVLVVDAIEGQPVEKGDRLVVMEAMKMETALRAPRDGIIEVVGCAVGDAVENGRLLVRLQEQD